MFVPQEIGELPVFPWDASQPGEICNDALSLVGNPQLKRRALVEGGGLRTLMLMLRV
jgi:hypothetical protein